MKKKKIAICMRDMQIGGCESVLIRMLDALLKTGRFDITLITYVKVQEPTYAAWFAAHPEIKKRVLYPSRFFGTRLPRFFVARLFMHMMRDVYRFVRFMKMRARYFADIETFVDFYDFGFHREFKKFRGRKIAWWHSSINKFMDGRGWRHVGQYDVFVTLTDGFANEFSTRYPHFANRVVRIYNPINIQSIRTRAAQASDCPVGKWFVCVARVAADKDPKTVLHAFDRFWCDAGRPHDVRLFMVGGGAELSHWRSVVEKMESGKNIVFTGAVSNPFGYMRGAMANILSSYAEGFAMVLVEAAALNTLNIASDCKNGPREILMSGRAGLLFHPGDVDSLAAHMGAVYRDDVDRADMIKQAEHGLARFEAAGVIDQICKLFIGE